MNVYLWETIRWQWPIDQIESISRQTGVVAWVYRALSIMFDIYIIQYFPHPRSGWAFGKPKLVKAILIRSLNTGHLFSV